MQMTNDLNISQQWPKGTTHCFVWSKSIPIPSNLRHSRTFLVEAADEAHHHHHHYHHHHHHHFILCHPCLPSPSSQTLWDSLFGGTVVLRRSAIQSVMSCSSSQETVWPMSSYSHQSTDTSTYNFHAGVEVHRHGHALKAGVTSRLVVIKKKKIWYTLNGRIYNDRW